MITYDEKFKCPYCRRYVKPRMDRMIIDDRHYKERYYCPSCKCTIEVRNKEREAKE